MLSAKELLGAGVGPVGGPSALCGFVRHRPFAVSTVSEEVR